jgi:predicted cobalt transporter CbtA
MLMDYMRRGLKAGLIGGIVYGVFVALIGNPLISFIETMRGHHGSSHAHAHTHASMVSGAVTNAVSIGGGIVLGLLFGAVVFGSVYYFFEPEIPGRADTRSYLLGGAGFITVSGAPWLLFPPQLPGAEQVLPVDVRIAWYAIMMGVGAIVCCLSGYTYVRLCTQRRIVALAGGVVPLFLIPVVAVLGATSLGVRTGIGMAGTGALVRSFQAIVAFGQIGLWTVIAGVHAWLIRREQVEQREQQEQPLREQDGSIWIE